MAERKNGRGGGFLFDCDSLFDAVSPENFTDDQRAMRDAVAEFMAQEVAPKTAAIENKDTALLASLVKQAGQLGFLGIEVPEDCGGLGQDLVTSAMVAEAIGRHGGGSMAVTLGAHTGIGMWPILYFGSDAQRQKYLPKLASGEMIAAYALTEPGSGSDALSGKCKAVLSPDGTHYVVNGEKTFITNAAIADLFTVFVKIDGSDEKKACLLVERGTPGFTMGKEEHKMGIRGSSTCSLLFEDAKVPAENLLGPVGKGHKVVLNTLNLGRFKLGAGAVGAIKAAVTAAVQYAAGRKQFGRAIADFDPIRAKIADMVVAAWVGESMVYRTAGLLEDSLKGAAPGEASIKAIEEFTIECSIVKVACSELLDMAVDENLQIHGGYGYVEEYPAERMYRDSRINRIFEGTNEINRMVAAGTLLRKLTPGKGCALSKKRMNRLFAAYALRRSFDRLPLSMALGLPKRDDPAFNDALDAAKRVVLMTFVEAMVRRKKAIMEDGQTLLALADALTAVYAMESAKLRRHKVPHDASSDSVVDAIVGVAFDRELRILSASCERVLASLCKGTERANKVARVRAAIGPYLSGDPHALKRRIAAAAAERNGYPF